MFLRRRLGLWCWRWFCACCWRCFSSGRGRTGVSWRFRVRRSFGVRRRCTRRRGCRSRCRASRRGSSRRARWRFSRRVYAIRGERLRGGNPAERNARINIRRVSRKGRMNFRRRSRMSIIFSWMRVTGGGMSVARRRMRIWARLRARMNRPSNHRNQKHRLKSFHTVTNITPYLPFRDSLSFKQHSLPTSPLGAPAHRNASRYAND